MPDRPAIVELMGPTNDGLSSIHGALPKSRHTSEPHHLPTVALGPDTWKLLPSAPSCRSRAVTPEQLWS